MEATPDSNLLLTTAAAAKRLNLANGTLRIWRIRGTGPRFVRLGAAIRYTDADLQAWVASNTRSSTSEAA